MNGLYWDHCRYKIEENGYLAMSWFIYEMYVFHTTPTDAKYITRAWLGIYLNPKMFAIDQNTQPAM